MISVAFERMKPLRGEVVDAYAAIVAGRSDVAPICRYRQPPSDICVNSEQTTLGRRQLPDTKPAAIVSRGDESALRQRCRDDCSVMAVEYPAIASRHIP